MLPYWFSHWVLEQVILWVSLYVSSRVAVSSNCHVCLGRRVSISHRADFDGAGKTGSTGKVRGREDWPRPISLLVTGEKERVQWRGWCPGAPGGDSEHSDLPMVHRAGRMGESRI